MKKNLRLAFASLLLGVCGQAAPFNAIGQGVELFLTGTAGIRADDNIFLSTDGESDLIFEFVPGVELGFGKNAQFRGTFTLKDTFSVYADNSDLNTGLVSAVLATRFDDGKLKLKFGAGFRELNQNSFDIRPTAPGLTPGLVRRDVFDTNAEAEVEISQLTSVAAGLTFARENYKRTGYTDSEMFTVPIDVFYKYTAKTDLSVGYRYRDTRVDLGLDSADHFFNVGARGEFSPKLTGRFAVGLNRRTVERGGGDSQLGLDSSFAYELTPKTLLEFGAAKDFGTSPQGQQIKNTSLRALVTARLAAEWSVTAGALWRAIDYGPRTDDYYEFQIGAAYIISANIRLMGGFIHRDYGSGARFAEFKNNVFSFSADFRY
jgi:hypothetical protein